MHNDAANGSPSPYALGQRKTLSSELASILTRQIESGEYAPGDVLPSEQALAELFVVSRPVVREALARLKQQGIITPRRGQAPIVAKSPEFSSVYAEGFDELSGDKYLQFNRFRVVVEGECAALAALNATDEQIARLLAYNAAMEADFAEGRAGIEPDLQFHFLIAAASGNKYLHDLVKAIPTKIWMVVHQGRSLSNRDREYERQVCREHKAIAEAIAARNPHAARLAARTHLLHSAHRQGFPLDRSFLVFS